MKKGIGELLIEVSKITSRKQKIAALRAGHSEALEVILHGIYDPNIVWALPNGEPPFKKLDKAEDQQGRLFVEIRRLKIFVEGNQKYNNMPRAKREMLFIQILESIDPDDADLLVAMKDKTPPWKTLTRKLMEEAFPSVSKGWGK